MQGKAPRPTIGSSKWCAVTRRHQDPDGWFNTGCMLNPPEPHVWISMAGARVVAQWAGWTSPAEHAETVTQRDALRAQLDQAVAEISELRKTLEQVDGLEATGMTVKRTGGRPTRRTRPEVIRAELEEATA